MTTVSGRLRPSPTATGPLARRGTRRRSAAARTARVTVLDRPEPWGRGAVAAALVLVALGLIGLVVGWVGISDSADMEEQARWLALSIGSLIVAGFGMVAWLLAGLVAVGTLRRTVLRDVAARAPANWAALSFAAPPSEALGRFGIATGMRRYHRPECDLLAGKTVRWLDAQALEFAVTEPCGMCSPTSSSSTSSIGSAPRASSRRARLNRLGKPDVTSGDRP